MITRKLISNYDGHACKTVAEWLAEDQKARDVRYNETAGRPQPKTDQTVTLPTSAQAQQAMEADKQGRIASEVDAYNANQPAREAKAAEMKANPAKAVLDLFSGQYGSPVSQKRSRQVEAGCGSDQSGLAAEKAEADALQAFHGSDDFQIALRSAEATVAAQQTERLKTRALENLSYVKAAKSVEALGEYWRTERGIVVDQCRCA